LISEQTGAVEVAPNLWRLALPITEHTLGGANAFLLRDRDGYVLFDCGADSPECSEALTHGLAGLGIPFDALHTIIVSHGHPDHGGQASHVRDKAQAQIFLHEREARYLGYPHAGGEPDRQQLRAWLRRYGFPEPEIDPLIGAPRNNGRHAIVIQSDRMLAGGEILEIGAYRFKVLWTPGHTPGHICLYDASRQLLLSGDHVLEVVTPNVGLHPLHDGNPMPGYLDSLADLAGRDIELTLPGHGDPIADLGKQAAELTRRQLSRRAQLLTLLTDVPQSAYELAAQIWPPRPGRRSWEQFHGHLRRNAVGTLAAHLDVLVDTGEAVASEESATVRFRRA
jgi:glyoxylase-like metal-dependent hydrolase (beta-lactamase superfamily II)